MNKKSKGMLALVITVVTLVGAAVMVVYGYRAATIDAGSDGVRITGMYGLVIPYGEIAAVEISDTIPRVLMRTNGYSLGGSNKGFFSVDDWGKTRLFTYPSHKGPYLVITGKDGAKTVFETCDGAHAVLLRDTIEPEIK